MAFSPAVRAAAIAEVKRGLPRSDVARRYGTTKVTIGRWLREAEDAAPIAPSPVPDPNTFVVPPSPPAPVEDEDDEDVDTLTRTRRMLARVERIAKQAEGVGNHTAAQRAMRDAAALSATIARIERLESEHADVLRIPVHELKKLRESVRRKLAAHADRPLLCADCGRELSVSWGAPKEPLPQRREQKKEDEL